MTSVQELVLGGCRRSLSHAFAFAAWGLGLGHEMVDSVGKLQAYNSVCCQRLCFTCCPGDARAVMSCYHTSCLLQLFEVMLDVLRPTDASLCTHVSWCLTTAGAMLRVTSRFAWMAN